MARKRGRQDDEVASDGDVFESSVIEDRASKFVAIYSPTIPPRKLQARAEYESASHRMLAWRTPSKQQSLVTSQSTRKVVYDTGSDDDGEKYGGKRLEKLLIELEVEGAVVVARWYGGVLLGPVRFTHIETVAKEAIENWRAAQGGASKSLKRAKVEDAATVDPEEVQRQKDALARQLEDRDNNIVVLRGLLAEKQAAKNDKTEEISKPLEKRAAPPLDYARMPLPALKQLEKARDATIAWILKQLDEAEVENSKSST